MTLTPARLPSPPAVNGAATGGWLVDQLPGCFAGDDFLRRFIALFQELADGLRRRIDGIEHAVDATVAPPVFVRWMGGWLGVTSIDPSLPERRQRELAFGFGSLLVRRGTRTGLQQALELVTGQRVEVRDPGATVRDGDPAPPAGPVRSAESRFWDRATPTSPHSHSASSPSGTAGPRART